MLLPGGSQLPNVRRTNIVVAKGHLVRTRRDASYAYWGEGSHQAMRGDVLGRAFGGPAANLVPNRLSTKDVDAYELQELRQLISRNSKEQW